MSPAQGYWQVVLRSLRGNPSGMAGLATLVAVGLLSLSAPLVANDRPLVCQDEAGWHFPAFTSYVDAWVPWAGARTNLKSWKVGDSFPFGDHYPHLHGRSWSQAPCALSVWPPVPHSPTAFDRDVLKRLPDAEHRLGTDDQGRDILARLIHGSIVSVLVGFLSTAVAASIGIPLGLISGYYGGWLDALLGRVTEVVMCFPTFFLIIAVLAFLPPSTLNLVLVLGLLGWTGLYRLVRGETLAVCQRDYVSAARALGLSDARILTRHVLPNAINPAFVQIAFMVASAILTETALSFLGFGDTSAPSWGETIRQGRNYVSEGLWHLVVFPGLALFVTLTGFNLFGQALRDAMDPKLRGLGLAPGSGPR